MQPTRSFLRPTLGRLLAVSIGTSLVLGACTNAAPSPAAAPGKPTSAPSGASAKAPVSYAGQTVRIVVGYATGGGYDNTARLLSRHLGNHLPGNPQVIVENMEGAASKVAANYLYNNAPKDGTVIGSVNPQLIMDQVTGAEGVQFDARQFQWLGSAQSSTEVCAVRTNGKVTSFKEALETNDPVRIGANAPGDNTWTSPVMLKATTGVKFEVIPGYKGTNDLRVAVERGEIEGLCQSWESMSASSQIQNKVIRPIVQNASTKHPDLQDVPLADEFVKDAEGKRLLALTRAPREIDKPFLAPPGTAPERLEVLRAGVAAAFADPALKADAKSAKLDLQPKSGAEVGSVVSDLVATPPDALKRFQEILKP